MNTWALAALLLQLPVFAQTSDVGVLSGSALDSHHHPIAGAKLYIQRVGSNERLTAQTDSAAT